MKRASVLLALASAPVSAQLVNAPVAPDAIYVARFGASQGLSLVDLNGFGAGTGDPTYDPANPSVEGNSNYPNNPNLQLQGALLFPPLAPGTSTLDGGSSGVFTLTRNSALSDILIASPELGPVRDMMLGHPLDLVYNNGPAPFGCEQGGGNLCAASGLQVSDVGPGGPHTVAPGGGGLAAPGQGNPISWAPHPNPPPLLSVPLCAMPEILGQEPTSGFADQQGFINLLVPGDPFGNPALGVPPSGLLSAEQNSFFVGPLPAQPSIVGCGVYQMRQQVGHFLYALDARREELVVLNSNRFTVLDRIPLESPTELAMSPNLNLLAVSQRAADQVSFIDIEPSSPTFHQVVKQVAVGESPSGIAWVPSNEDILVCNEGDDSVSILSAFSLDVRKTVSGGLDRPFAIATTPRQVGFGFDRQVYLAYILDRSGQLHLFESGPDGLNGWGYDDLIGTAPMKFRGARAIQADPRVLSSAVWIAHEGQLDSAGQPTGLLGGAVTQVALDTDQFGLVPIVPGGPPNLHGFDFRIDASIGSDQLSGRPQDLAFDNLRNLGVLPNVANSFSAGAPLAKNGKGLVRSFMGALTQTSEPSFLFLPVEPVDGGAARIDVIDLATAQRVDTNPHQPGIQSIPAAGAYQVMDYFRQ